MPLLELLHQDTYRRMPWKNGGGTTAEIALFPPAGGDFIWRLSVAEVASSGPFSLFPGIDRWIVVIAGPGMLLHQGSETIELHPLRPRSFCGESETSGQLTAGPVRDLNLMTRRGAARGSLRVLDLNREPAPLPISAGTTLFHALGRVKAVVAGRTLAIEEGQTLRIDTEERDHLVVEASSGIGAPLIEAHIEFSATNEATAGG